MTQEPLVREAEVAAFRDAVLTKLTYAVGKDPDHAFDHDWFEAIALAARDHMVAGGESNGFEPIVIKRMIGVLADGISEFGQHGVAKCRNFSFANKWFLSHW